MPADTNQNGDIFGGWLLSQMDVGGGMFASKLAKSRTVTVAIEAMNFRKPVYVGDLVSVHANLVKIGKHVDHGASRGLGPAPQGNAVDPGDRRQFHLCLDRRGGPSAGRPARRSADPGVIIVGRSVFCASPPHPAPRFPLPLRMTTWQNRPCDPLLSKVGVGRNCHERLFKAGFVLLACTLSSIEIAAAQPANPGSFLGKLAGHDANVALRGGDYDRR